MARRRSSGKKEVSLFPFLDILGCLIGSLILIITTVVLEQMDTKPVAEAAKIDDMKQQAAQQEKRRRALEQRLAALVAQAGPAEERLTEARERLEEVARKEAEARQRLVAAEQMVIDPPKPPPPADTSALEAKRQQLDAEAARIRTEIAMRKKVPEQSIVILPPTNGGSGGPKRGVFVEAAAGKVVVHEPPQPWEAPAGKLAGNPQVLNLVKKIAADKDAILTFLIRPDGISTYNELTKVAEAAGARTGRVPLPGTGVLDLSEAR
ncbi:MAG: hypothetical protein ACKOEM_18555 [Planctomycetia bacterium]